MRRAATLSLVAILVWSIVQLFSIDDALIKFIILGQIPGTEYQLNILLILVLLGAAIGMVIHWAKNFSAELIDSKLAQIRAEQMDQKELAILSSKAEHASDVAKQLDIDELDLISF